MEFDQVLKGRRTTRIFKPDKVPREIMEKIIEAATYAPSSCNAQQWRFIIVDDDSLKEKLLKEKAAYPIIKHQPTLVYVLYKRTSHLDELRQDIQSASAAIQNMCLKAYGLGVGSEWQDGFGNINIIKRIFKIPEDFIIVAAVAFGYPKEWPKPPRKRANIHFYNTFYDTERHPPRKDIKLWNIEQIRTYNSFKIRAKSPLSPEYQPQLKHEFKEVIKHIPKMEGKTLDVLPLLANHTQELIKNGKVDDLSVIEMSDEVIDFMKTKLGKDGEKIKYIRGTHPFPLEEGSFENAICFNSLEKVPDPFLILKEINRALTKSGRLFIVFNNKISLYGAFFYYIILKEGNTHTMVPYRPLSLSELKSMLSKAGFKIEKKTGIDLIPKTKYETFNSHGILGSFCKAIILQCRKVE